MRKIIIITVSISILLLAAATYISYVGSNTPSRESISIDDVSNEDIAQTISQRLSENGITYTQADIEITDKHTFKDTWIITRAIITPLPVEDEGREMIYVLRITDNILETVAYSGDGFSSNAFPANTPIDIIEEANKE